MGCVGPWPRTMRCCVRRSRRTAAGCLSTPVTGCASPRSAVDAAVAAQLELQLPVRMGLATGEAELRDGDYFGAVLNRAARVMAAGHGGQILEADSQIAQLVGTDNYASRYGPDRHRVRGAYLHGPVDG
jgi:class 3 adenylate cyclase